LTQAYAITVSYKPRKRNWLQRLQKQSPLTITMIDTLVLWNMTMWKWPWR